MKLKSNQERSFDFLKRRENTLIISLYVKPNSNKNSINISQQEMIVTCTSPAVKGKANKSVIRMLSDFFNVSNNCVEIISGFKSKRKIIKILKQDDFSLESYVKKLLDTLNG